MTTNNKTYKDKPIYVKSINDIDDSEERYFIPVVAKDQYDNQVAVEELNDSKQFGVSVSDERVLKAGDLGSISTFKLIILLALPSLFHYTHLLILVFPYKQQPF